jgi:hypothetical protein
MRTRPVRASFVMQTGKPCATKRFFDLVLRFAESIINSRPAISPEWHPFDTKYKSWPARNLEIRLIARDFVRAR